MRISIVLFLFFSSLKLLGIETPKKPLLSLHEFSSLSYPEFKSVYPGKILNRLEFIAAKRSIKKGLRKRILNSDEAFHPDQFKMDWLGFALGFGAGVIGLLVSIFIDKKRENFLKSAVIGFITTTLIGAVVLIVILGQL